MPEGYKNFMDKKLKMRVFSCIETVLGVHELFENTAFNNELMNEIKSAKDKLLNLSSFEVNEEQVTNIEIATNHLLGMISNIAEEKKINKIYGGVLH